MRLSDFLLLVALSLASALSACWVLPEEVFAPPDFTPGNPAAVVDTCEAYDPVTTPKFSNLYSGTSPHPQSPTTFYLGQSDTLYWLPGEPLAETLDSALTAIWPAYDFRCFGDDPEYMHIVVIGSDDATFWQRNIRFESQFVFRGGYGAMPYGLFLGGTATAEEFAALADTLQSVQWFNIKGDYDSLQITTIARALLGDCKQGGEWADFRFNNAPISQALIDSFHLAQWELVLQ